MSAAGSHTRVVPEDFSASMRVVTSNVRQLSDAAPCATRRPAFGNARVADTMLADRRKSRRFINLLSFDQYSFGLLPGRQSTPDSVRMQWTSGILLRLRNGLRALRSWRKGKGYVYSARPRFRIFASSGSNNHKLAAIHRIGGGCCISCKWKCGLPE